MPSKSTSLSRLGKNTALYTVSILASRLASFLLLPLFTRHLTPADYGLLQLLDMTVDIGAILLTAGMAAGLQVFYFKCPEGPDRNAVVSTAFLLDVAVSVAATIAIILSSELLWERVLAENGTSFMVRLVGLNFTLSMLSGIPLSYMRIRQESTLVVVASLSRFALQMSFNIAFVVGMQMGPIGILWSTFVTNLVLGSILGAWLLREVGARLVRAVAKDLVRFGVPTQITLAGSFIMTFGDRFFLQASHGVTTVGLYGLAYQFGFLLSYVSSDPFLQAWTPQMFLLGKSSQEERNARYNQGLFFLSVLTISGGVCLALVTPGLLRIMTTAAFFSASDVVPIIILAYLLQSLTFLMKFGTDFSEKPSRYTLATWISVVTTVVAYATLIPRWGAPGAAWATVIGFAVRFFLTYRWSQQLFPIAYEWGRVSLMALCALAVVVPLQFVHVTSTVTSLAVAAAGITAFALAMWLIVFRGGERALVVELARSPRAVLAKMREGPSLNAQPQ